MSGAFDTKSHSFFFLIYRSEFTWKDFQFKENKVDNIFLKKHALFLSLRASDMKFEHSFPKIYFKVERAGVI